MSGGPRLPLERAERLAGELVERFTPACERIQIAGSIRRQAPDVGDIEIVAIPRSELRSRMLDDLFNTVEEFEVNCLDEVCDQMLAQWGLYRDFGLDIYSVTPETWGVTLALRTGPAQFSKRLVTSQMYGGLCPSHLQFKDWRVVQRSDGIPLDTPEEEDVFRVLGYQFVPPNKRWFATWPDRIGESISQ